MPLASSSLSSPLGAPLRLAIVGGTQARARYTDALTGLPALQVVALADPDKRMARAWARQFGGHPQVWENLETLLADAPELDAVLIASPPQERTAHIAAVARARKAILCEIPAALRLTETDAALRAAAENGVLLMPVLPRRFDAHLQPLARYAEAGTLGTLRQARCDWTFPASGAEAGEGGWHLLLQQAACQTADLCRWWLGDALTVSADIEIPRRRAPGQRQAPALANIIVTHERGQSVHHLACVASTLSSERYKLIGAQGHLELSFGAGAPAAYGTIPALTLHRPGQRPEPIAADAGEASGVEAMSLCYRRLLAHFVECIQTGCAPLVRGADARAALEILQAAYLSAQEGHKVSLPLRRAADNRALGPAPPDPAA